MGFSRQEYWSGLLFPSPGDPPDPGNEPGSPALQADTLPSEPPGKSIYILFGNKSSHQSKGMVSENGLEVAAQESPKVSWSKIMWTQPKVFTVWTQCGDNVDE